MSGFERISIQQANTIMTERQVAVVDIRDGLSFQQGHIAGAQMLDNRSLPAFMAATSSDTPIIVYCYHGNSSQGAAQFLNEQGFIEVYSMDGGFEAWRTTFPVSDN